MDFTGAERDFCALNQTRSVTIAQRKFSTKFKKKSPTKKIIKKWHSNFVETGIIAKPRKAPTMQPNIRLCNTRNGIDG